MRELLLFHFICINLLIIPSYSAGELLIFIKLDDRKQPIIMPSDATINCIHAHVHHYFGLANDSYSLSFAEAELTDLDPSTPLADAGICAESVIHVTRSGIYIVFTFTRKWEVQSTQHDHNIVHYEDGIPTHYYKIFQDNETTHFCSFDIDTVDFFKAAESCLVTAGKIESADLFRFNYVPNDMDFRSQNVRETNLLVHDDIVSKLIPTPSHISNVSRNNVLVPSQRHGVWCSDTSSSVPIDIISDVCSSDNLQYWFPANGLSFTSLSEEKGNGITYQIYFTLPPGFSIGFGQRQMEQILEDNSADTNVFVQETN
eukprot:25635_1